MNRVRRLILLCLVCACASVQGQTNVSVPPLPSIKSPIDAFRELYAMSPAERTKALANRPEASRQRLLEKIREYQKLGADERELRLRVTELRWWLLPLMRENPTNRSTSLNLVPKNLRSLVEERLTAWDLLPPELQQAQLESEDVAEIFTRIQNRTPQQREQILNTLPPGVGKQLEHWTAMTAQERRQTCEQFDRFFELDPREKRKVLGTLSDTERQQMEQTLRSFEKLPREQRLVCLRSFEKFIGLSAAERQQFLKNAEHWEKMSPAERETWRRLVRHVPDFPPLPQSMDSSMPPMPPATSAPRALFTNGGG